MALSAEELKIGQETFTRITDYELRKKGRLWTYFGLVFWSFQTSLLYLLRPSHTGLAIVIIWFVMALLFLKGMWESKRAYLRDSVTLEELKKRHGSEVSFDVESKTEKDPADTNKTGEPLSIAVALLAFCVFLIACFIFAKVIGSLFLRLH